MKIDGCPNGACGHFVKGRGRFYVKKGSFTTKWNAQPVPRYRCLSCGRYFSTHTFRLTWRQKKPYLNALIFNLYCSAVTQRRIAKVLGINRKTVVNKFRFLARWASAEHLRQIAKMPKVEFAQLDEMESFEHTRLKPLSIALVVNSDERVILSAELATMNAKGRLADIARKKYGYRKDTRPEAVSRGLSVLKEIARSSVTITTDKNPAYPPLIKSHFPEGTHLAKKSRGEIRFLHQRTRRRNENDPLFVLNHTCAKIRHDLSRMARKVWVTTKQASRLKDHLDLYIAFHNHYLLPA